MASLLKAFHLVEMEIEYNISSNAFILVFVRLLFMLLYKYQKSKNDALD